MNPYVFVQPDLPPPAPTPEQELWQEVIRLAVIECEAPRCVYTKRVVAETLRRQARAWILTSPDFVTVCEMAGLAPSPIRRVVEKLP